MSEMQVKLAELRELLAEAEDRDVAADGKFLKKLLALIAQILPLILPLLDQPAA